MRILFVILTCEQYAQTRQRWQLDTWLKGCDYVYLNESYGKEGYLNVATKYVDFFKTFDISNYDWLFFCDDDTFVFTKELENFIFNYDPNDHFCIGNKIGEFIIETTDIKTTCFSGGAGIAISGGLADKIQLHLDLTDPIITNESDTSLAVWSKLSTPEVIFIDKSNLFSPINPRHEFHNGKHLFITYHYCAEKDFKKLGELL